MSIQVSTFLSEDVYAYPASSRNDGGQDNSEKNLRSISGKMSSRNYVVATSPRPTPEYLSLSISQTNVLNIAKGEFSIRGYYFSFNKDVSVDVSSVTPALSANTLYHLTLHLVLDQLGQLMSDSSDASSSSLLCRCIQFVLLTDSDISQLIEGDYEKNYLELGTVSTDGSGNLTSDTEVAQNDQKYAFIDSDSVTTKDGTKLETWIENYVGDQINHVSKLFYYDTEGATSPSATFELTKVDNTYDLIFKVGSSQKYSLNNINTRTTFAGSGGTYGSANSPARSDHTHDGRYVRLTPGSSTAVQQIKSPVDVTSFSVGSTKFVAKSDGSVEAASGKVKVGSDGSVNANGLTVSPTGNVNTSGTITASKVYNAVWNDLAENYLKDNKHFRVEPGTVIAKVKGKNTYKPCDPDDRKLVVGVVSDTYGYLLGGDQDKSPEENLESYYPVALAGRVKVLVDPDVTIEEGDLLVASPFFSGSVRPLDSEILDRGTVIGKALESSDGTKSKVLVQVMLR